MSGEVGGDKIVADQLEFVVTTLLHTSSWAAQYNIGLLIKLTPKGVVFSFLFFSYIPATV